MLAIHGYFISTLLTANDEAGKSPAKVPVPESGTYAPAAFIC